MPISDGYLSSIPICGGCTLGAVGYACKAEHENIIALNVPRTESTDSLFELR